MLDPSKITILHVCGSDVSKFHYTFSKFSASEAVKSLKTNGFDHHVMIEIHQDDGASLYRLDGSDWKLVREGSFLECAASTNTGQEKLAVIPHTYCLRGMTQYRAALDCLNAPVLQPGGPVMHMMADKWTTRCVFEAEGLPVPRGILVRSPTDLRKCAGKFSGDVIVKPRISDNSLGVTRCNSSSTSLNDGYETAVAFHDEVIVEEYIPLGKELRTAVLERQGSGPVFLPPLEYKITNDKGIRRAADKVQVDASGRAGGFGETIRNFEIDLPMPTLTRIEEVSQAAHSAFGRPGYSIFDIRVDPAGHPFIIEAASYCSFKESSALCVLARQGGISQTEVFGDVLAWAEGALENGGRHSRRAAGSLL